MLKSVEKRRFQNGENLLARPVIQSRRECEGIKNEAIDNRDDID
jgi:hypothetical protein